MPSPNDPPEDVSLAATAPSVDELPVPQSPDTAKPPAGQLGTFAILGAAVGTVPVPWLPGALARRLRGALVQDIAARHRIALCPEARAVLADPKTSRQKRGAIREAFAYLGRKLLVRFGPLAVLPPLRAALETYILGYLFARYLERGRHESGKVLAAEATWIRSAIERTVLKVASPDGGIAWPTAPVPLDDSRDELTQALDGLLSATATIPSWLLQRLDRAFDDVLREAR